MRVWGTVGRGESPLSQSVVNFVDTLKRGDGIAVTSLFDLLYSLLDCQKNNTDQNRGTADDLDDSDILL